MPKKLMLVFSFVSIISCGRKKGHLPNTHSLYLFSRDVGGNNGYVSYSDNVVIDNYENKTLTIAQLYQYAKKYIDTVKADKNISDVTFIGKRADGYLPTPGWDNLTEQRKYSVASFGFDNGLKQYANNRIHKLTGIAIWRNWEAIDFMIDSHPPYFEKYYKKIVDSLLNCPIPVDTGF